MNRTDDQLIAEVRVPVLQTLDKSYYASDGRFLSLSSANDFVNRVLERNAPLVDLVATGASEEQWLEIRFGYPTGREAAITDDALEPQIRDTYNVGVLIVHDSRRARGYLVKTAYPLNNYPGETRF